MAMGLGVCLGHFVPGFSSFFEQFSLGSTHIPIAIGLIVMMYPPLAKFNYALISKAFTDFKSMLVSTVLNWVVGPWLMFVLAVVFFRDQPAYFSGLLLIGIARCIAMVLVWNDLAGGNKEYAALLVALNSVFQVLTYGVYAWFFITVAPHW